jgi:Zn-dependent peptidase ImmA (M78 family)/transcriptional regulator with XRE-family HTH domain
MIKNSYEYDITSSILKNFEVRKAYLFEQPHSKETDLEINSIDVIINDLQNQLQLYIDIQSGKVTFDRIETIQDISKVFIGKRIQLNYTQSELSQKLGIDSEEYTILENNDFYGIPLELFNKILDILDLNNPNRILTKDYDQLIPLIEKNIKNLNINTSFLPISLKQVKQLVKDKSSIGSYYVEKVIDSIKQIFSINIDEDITHSQINSNIAVAFKHRININEDNLTTTTGYAAYIAKILANQMNSTINIKADPILIRTDIINKYGSVNLDTCLDFIWNLNIAVLPLNMHGSFHGACFDFESTKVIVLSQQNKTVSRWKFDLLHELYHALTMNYVAYIERTDIMDQNDGEEKLASEFASYVIFGQEMESLLQMILERSESKIEQIKKNIISVSEEFEINLDDLANYVAFRISEVQINLWGVAANLQTDKRDPVDILINNLYKNVIINEISPFELEILQISLY